MLTGVVLTLAAWPSPLPPQLPVSARDFLISLGASPTSLSLLALLFSASLVPLSLVLSLQGKGQQQDQLRLLQERKGSRSLCPATAPGKGGGRRWWRCPPPTPAPPQVHPAGSWALALPCSSRAERRPTGPSLFPLHLTPSLGLRGECGLTLPSPQRVGFLAAMPLPTELVWICRALTSPLHV